MHLRVRRVALAWVKARVGSPIPTGLKRDRFKNYKRNFLLV
jgi:hypothetical protein